MSRRRTGSRTSMTLSDNPSAPVKGHGGNGKVRVPAGGSGRGAKPQATDRRHAAGGRLPAFPARMPMGQFLFEYLHRRGVRHSFGVPGDFALPTFAWLDKSPIESITMTHEPGAGFGRPLMVIVAPPSVTENVPSPRPLPIGLSFAVSPSGAGPAPF